MGKFSLYSIPLRSLTEGVHEFDYVIDKTFFKLINDAESDLQRGSVNVKVVVKRKNDMFEFNFSLNGEVFIPCDRCLDDMIIEVTTQNRMIVKFGKEYSEESDEIVIIPEEDGEINIAWFLYEFILLSLPMKHVHPSGKCNRFMTSKLNKHRTTSTHESDDDDDDVEIDDSDTDIQASSSLDDQDSRWDALKDVSFED